MDKFFKIAFLLIGLSLLFGVAFYYQQKPKTILLSGKHCEFTSKTCTIKYQGEKFLEITFKPKQGSARVNNLEPFTLEIQNLLSKKRKIDKFHIRFQGLDMNLNSFSDLLTKDGQLFKDQLRLPYCSLKKMAWNLKISFQTYKNDQKQNFIFINQFDVFSVK